MAVRLADYIQDGIELDIDQGELHIDLNSPRKITVYARNELTHVKKVYILKVTEKGLCLV